MEKELRDLKQQILEMRQEKSETDRNSSIKNALQKADLGDDSVAYTFVSSFPPEEMNQRIKQYKQHQSTTFKSIIEKHIEQAKQRQEEAVESSSGLGLMVEPLDVRERQVSQRDRPQTSEEAKDQLGKAIEQGLSDLRSVL